MEIGADTQSSHTVASLRAWKVMSDFNPEEVVSRVRSMNVLQGKSLASFFLSRLSCDYSNSNIIENSASQLSHLETLEPSTAPMNHSDGPLRCAWTVNTSSNP